MSNPQKGTVVVHEIESQVLQGNALNDPTRRRVHVYLPAGHPATSSQTSATSSSHHTSYPVILALSGMYGSGASYFPDEYNVGWNLACRLDRLIAEGKCRPVIIVAPDCDTIMGGAQFLNSEGTGRYEDHITQEVMPFIRKKYNVPEDQRWGSFGISSGGYGSFMIAMRHPDLFACVGDHSGDGLFDETCKDTFGRAAEEYEKHGGVYKWYHEVYLPKAREDWGSRGSFGDPIGALAMSRIYSPNPISDNKMGCDFPINLETGEFRPEIWSKWTDQDPVYIIVYNLDNLRKLRLIYLDGGDHDEFGLNHAAENIARQLREKLGGIGPKIFFEEYHGGHFGSEFRYDVSIPMIVHALENDK
eukprot:Phypoly_transcript_09385.p1 GENE.Phypoly_transcript_09385~~Phypoly_transcript_09385.p1  ORF type:complete len:360 (+),score=35.51 Phypoly_transcript_09385:102-1181(+)